MNNDFLDYRENYLAHYGVKGMKWGKHKTRFHFRDGEFRQETAGKTASDWDYDAAGADLSRGGLKVYNTQQGRNPYTDDKHYRKRLGNVTFERAEDGYSATIHSPAEARKLRKEHPNLLGRSIAEELFNRIAIGQKKSARRRKAPRGLQRTTS